MAYGFERQSMEEGRAVVERMREVEMPIEARRVAFSTAPLPYVPFDDDELLYKPK